MSDSELRKLITDIARTYQEPAPGDLPSCWSTLVELGLPLVGISEVHGGSGGSLEDLVVLVRTLGRHAISSPLIEDSVANWVLSRHRRVLSPGLRTIAIDWRGAVSWARHAEQLVTYLGDDVMLADLKVANAAIRTGINIAGEPWDTIMPSSMQMTLLGSVPTHDEVLARLGLLRAAALTGAVEGAYELTKDYVRMRNQFGRPLVRIPAVAANLARIKTGLLQCDAALARAHDQRLASVAAARIITGRVATETAHLAHALHGAMGTTAEYALHRFTTRLWTWRDADISEHDWSVLLGDIVARNGEAVFWEELTATA